MFYTDRRNFGKLAFAGAIGGKSLLMSSFINADEKINTSRVKIAAQFKPDDELGMSITKQLGVKHLANWTALNYENLSKLKQQAGEHGLSLTSASRTSNWHTVVLNMPGRDEAIEEFNKGTIVLGKAGIRQRNIVFYATGVTITHRVPARGGQMSRAFSINRPRDPKLTYGEYKMTLDRKYSPEEIWDNYTYFVRKAAPIAEDSNVLIAIHPEDPPGMTFGNEPRVIASSFGGYKRALEIADSPNIGMCLCVGCWLEGGENMGKDVIETIKYFGSRNKIFKVHFRNVSSTLPEFHETWPDDGYFDMYKVMKALVEVDADCIMTADHWPGRKTGGLYTGWVHCATYMKALLERANEEIA